MYDSKNLVVALDFTKSSNRDTRLLILEKAIEEAQRTNSLLTVFFYGIRAYPIVEFGLPGHDLVSMAAFIPSIEGPSEPYRPFRELLSFIIDHGLDPGDVRMVIHWSAPRKPMVPLVYGSVVADNLGVRWIMLVERTSPPRWFWRWADGVSDNIIFFLRKNTNIGKLIRNLLIYRD